MSRKFRLALSLLVALLPVLPVSAESPNTKLLEARVREMHAKSCVVKVTLVDGTALQGRILRIGADSFTIRQTKTGRETAVRYAQAKEVRKSGLTRRAKAILIPTVVGGCAFVVLCAAPYPIGALCRKDPS